MMMRIPVRLLIAATFLVGALPQGSLARTEESLVWTEKSSEGLVSLTYGPLDPAKTPLFLLTCFNSMEVAVLEIFGVIEGTRPGQPLIIGLSAGSTELPLKGEVSLDDATGTMFAEANELKVKPVLDVLRASGPLTVNLGLTNKTLSDQGRADAVEKFSQSCELD
jgi:hypothetical protein